MNSSNTLRKALWANVAFAEIGALAAFFLNDTFAPINDMTDGQGVIFGIELLILSSLAAYTAWKPTVKKGLVQLIIALNTLLLAYFIIRLEDPAISAAGMELIAVDTAAVLALIIVQVRSLRAYSQAVKPTMVS